MDAYSVDKLMVEARQLASAYQKMLGRPLAISGEIAKYDAIRLLRLDPAPPAASGYDAVGRGARNGVRYQIKGRVVRGESRSNPRIGQLRMSQPWHRVVLVLMDPDLEAIEIHEANRASINALHEQLAASKRAGRGLMSVARFKIIGRLVWTRERGLEDDAESSPGARLRRPAQPLHR